MSDHQFSSEQRGFTPTNEGVYNALRYLQKTCQYYTHTTKEECRACPLRAHELGSCMFNDLYDQYSDWDGNKVEDWPLRDPGSPYAAFYQNI